MSLVEKIRKDAATAYVLGTINSEQFNKIIARTEGYQPMNHLVDDVIQILKG